MPTMDGEAAARGVKDDGQLKDTALVLVTSIAVRGDVARMKEAGFSACLTKPARASQLLNALITVWGNQKLAPSAEFVVHHPAAKGHTSIFPGESAQPVFCARVLIVEDNAVNQMVAALLMEKLGCRVDLATNGREAGTMVGLLPYYANFMACQRP